MAIAGTFISGGAGQILVVTHEPDRPASRAVLVVPAFAEEMNKSRRLVWETARALCEQGFRTIVPDLYGTGDSEGEFADATWDTWIADLCRTVAWARNGGTERFDALLVRFGAALFSAAEQELGTVFERAVAWQPIHRGSEVLRQLLRMKSMAIRMSGGRVASLEALEQALVEGPDTMELGGYEVAPKLAVAVRQATFPMRGDGSGAIGEGLILEFASPTAAMDSPPSAADGDGIWRVRQIAAERFWNVVEPKCSPALVDATASFLSETP